MSKKLSIDGPAGRSEVTDKYRDNYDAIFRQDNISLYHHGVKVSETTSGGYVSSIFNRGFADEKGS